MYLPFLFHAAATTEFYALSLHDALPISPRRAAPPSTAPSRRCWPGSTSCSERSEEHTSGLQSQFHLVCRLLLEKKKPPLHARQKPMTAWSTTCKPTITTKLSMPPTPDLC